MDEDRVKDLPLQVDESGAIKVVGKGGEIRKQLGKTRTRRGALMLREVRALIAKCHADAGKNGVMGR